MAVTISSPGAVSAEVIALQTETSALQILQKRVVVAFGSFSGLGAGVKTFDVNVGTALPANARVMAAIVGDFTGFDDATHGTFTLTLGSSAGGNQVGTSLNIAAGQTGFPKPFSAGAQGYLLAAQSSTQLSARVTSSVDLNTASAGSMSITVFYIVIA